LEQIFLLLLFLAPFGIGERPPLLLAPASSPSEKPDTLWLGYAGGGHFVEMRTCRMPWIGAEFWRLEYDLQTRRLTIRGEVVNENASYQRESPVWLVGGRVDPVPAAESSWSGDERVMDETVRRGARLGRSFVLTLEDVGRDEYIAFVPRSGEGEISAVSTLYRIGALLDNEADVTPSSERP
jgi:hypothetical protein